MSYKVISVPVDQLRIHPSHPKVCPEDHSVINLEGVLKSKHQALIDDMVASYNVVKDGERTGQIYPILITSDKYILSGLIRWLAGMQLGMSHILCIVYDPKIDIGLFILQTNIGRGFSEIEKRKAALYLLSIIPSSQGCMTSKESVLMLMESFFN
jgi:hypothetical protein